MNCWKEYGFDVSLSALKTGKEKCVWGFQEHLAVAHNIIAENEGVAVITPKLEIKYSKFEKHKITGKIMW